MSLSRTAPILLVSLLALPALAQTTVVGAAPMDADLLDFVPADSVEVMTTDATVVLQAERLSEVTCRPKVCLPQSDCSGTCLSPWQPEVPGGPTVLLYRGSCSAGTACVTGDTVVTGGPEGRSYCECRFDLSCPPVYRYMGIVQRPDGTYGYKVAPYSGPINQTNAGSPQCAGPR